MPQGKQAPATAPMPAEAVLQASICVVCRRCYHVEQGGAILAFHSSLCGSALAPRWRIRGRARERENNGVAQPFGHSLIEVDPGVHVSYIRNGPHTHTGGLMQSQGAELSCPWTCTGCPRAQTFEPNGRHVVWGALDDGSNMGNTSPHLAGDSCGSRL